MANNQVIQVLNPHELIAEWLDDIALTLIEQRRRHHQLFEDILATQIFRLELPIISGITINMKYQLESYVACQNSFGLMPKVETPPSSFTFH
jgi:hypothetical protein